MAYQHIRKLYKLHTVKEGCPDLDSQGDPQRLSKSGQPDVQCVTYLFYNYDETFFLIYWIFFCEIDFFSNTGFQYIK